MRILTTAAQQIREWIACYGAVVAILVEQLSSVPRSNVSANPNPLVRIRDGGQQDLDWHRDEIITSGNGRSFVVVWDAEGRQRPADRAYLLEN